MYRKILVPVDGSEISVSVLPLICEIAGQHAADIVLFRVIEYPSSLYPVCYEYPMQNQQEMEAVRKSKAIICQQVQDYLRQVAAAVQSNVINVQTEFCEGPVVEAILEAANRLDIDLIAMAACGENRAVPGMIGSVADRVFHEASIPVMLFRPACSSETEGLPLPLMA